jgi:hypothetical protein
MVSRFRLAVEDCFYKVVEGRSQSEGKPRRESTIKVWHSLRENGRAERLAQSEEDAPGA